VSHLLLFVFPLKLDFWSSNSNSMFRVWFAFESLSYFCIKISFSLHRFFLSFCFPCLNIVNCTYLLLCQACMKAHIKYQ
jgi:hypothetical protein